jgi:hypothetical protein
MIFGESHGLILVVATDARIWKEEFDNKLFKK